MSLLRNFISHALGRFRPTNLVWRRSYHPATYHHESDEQCDARYECFFNRTDIDGWDVRQGMTDLLGMDMVPAPKIIIAAMYACRRVNDYALAVRFLEAVKDKTGPKCAEIYPYIIEEIAPVICELGIDTPEMLGFDVPECYIESVYDIH